MLSPVLTTLVPRCTSGWALLGEVEKFAALAERRFPSIACTPTGLDITVAGSGHEKVEVVLVDGHDVIIAQTVQIPEAGFVKLKF